MLLPDFHRSLHLVNGDLVSNLGKAIETHFLTRTTKSSGTP